MELRLHSVCLLKANTMAEIITASRPGRKTTLPRVDLTPMVDLGFLLISFFMFTTTLAEERTLELSMPDNTPTMQPQAVPEEATITIIPGKEHFVWYYTGAFDASKRLTRIRLKDVCGLITAQSNRVQNLPATYSKDAHKLHVLIKPASSSTYGDLVTMFDDMLINKIDYYVLMEPKANELVAMERSR